jgi:hypothetical protein
MAKSESKTNFYREEREVKMETLMFNQKTFVLLGELCALCGERGSVYGF